MSQKEFYKLFKPQLTPKKMLELGVFGGSYFVDGSIKEFPKKWFAKAKLTKNFDIEINYFKIESGLSRKEWIDKGWIFKEDPLVGFSGIVDLKMEEEFLIWMKFKLKDGRRLAIDIAQQLKKIAKRVISNVEEDKDRLYCNGHTILFSN